MSLKFQMLSKDLTVIAADTRVSGISEGGKIYTMHDNGHKLIAGDGFIMYVTGTISVVQNVLKELFSPVNDTLDLSNKHITEVMQKHHEITVQQKASDDDRYFLGISLTRLNKEGKIATFQFYPYSNFYEAEEITPPDNNEMIYSIDGFTKEMFGNKQFEIPPNEWVGKNMKSGDLIGNIRNFYSYYTCERFGGNLDIYVMDRFGNIENVIYNEKIMDKKYIFPTIPEIAESNDGNLIIGDHNFTIDADGTAHIKNIIMDGDITWNADSNPLKVKYSADGDGTPITLPDNWHDICRESDYFACYSYDAGKTWTTAVKIQGEDGAPGSDANVPAYIQSTHIDFEQVSSPEIRGNFVLGSEVQGGSFWDSNKSSKLILSNDGKHSDLTYSRADGDNLFKIYDGIDYASMQLNGMNVGYVGNSKDTFHAQGNWNLENANITGIKITFG